MSYYKIIQYNYSFLLLVFLLVALFPVAQTRVFLSSHISALCVARLKEAFRVSSAGCCSLRYGFIQASKHFV